MSFDFDCATNTCSIAKGVQLSGWIKGEGNIVSIESPLHECVLDLRISGNGNRITIRKPFAIKGLSVRIGNHVKAHETDLRIGEGFSIEGGGQFLLYNSGNKLHIGENCMFSNSITVRCSDSPHLLFDRVTGEYLDISEGVFIGDHVWVGERVYITKKASIPSECVAAACAVVTKKFDETHSVLAGNPAKVVRRNAQWIRNHSHLQEGSIYKTSLNEYKKNFDGKFNR